MVDESSRTTLLPASIPSQLSICKGLLRFHHAAFVCWLVVGRFKDQTGSNICQVVHNVVTWPCLLEIRPLTPRWGKMLHTQSITNLLAEEAMISAYRFGEHALLSVPRNLPQTRMRRLAQVAPAPGFTKAMTFGFLQI